MNKPSTRTLKTYLHMLERAAKGSLGSRKDLSKDEFRVAQELVDEGLLSSDFVQGPYSSGTIRDFTLTPSGAMALIDWRAFLARQRWWYPIAENLLRFLWVMVGALAASLTNLLNCSP